MVAGTADSVEGRIRKGILKMAKAKGSAAVLDDTPPLDPVAEQEERWIAFVEAIMLRWAKGFEPAADVRDALFKRLGIEGVKRRRWRRASG